jgi:hypothetical protein
MCQHSLAAQFVPGWNVVIPTRQIVSEAFDCSERSAVTPGDVIYRSLAFFLVQTTCRLLVGARMIGVWGIHDFELCFDPHSDLQAVFAQSSLSEVATVLEECGSPVVP